VIPSAKVSRQHASLTRVDGELYIEDLGSANGVWLNGEKVTRAKITAGDTFTISDETLLFEER
jgi:pSer/pThr/pTyr-binding forkhead associated (FHA) protein